jgi:hypothetical protein
LAAPSTVKFDAEQTALTDALNQSYYRVARDGSYPNFLAADYRPAYFVETFEDNAIEGWTTPATNFYTVTYESPADTVGAFAMALDGGNSNATVWNGANYKFVDNAGNPMSLGVAQLTSVSLKVRSADVDNVNHGNVFFGSSGSEGSGFGSMFRDNATLAFAAPAVAFAPPYTTQTWYSIEYTNFDAAGPSVEVLVDDVSLGTLTMGLSSISQLSVRSLGPTKFWLDQVVVR